MNLDERREEISIEFEHLQTITEDLLTLNNELTNRRSTTRKVTAAGAFLTQFYKWNRKHTQAIL